MSFRRALRSLASAAQRVGRALFACWLAFVLAQPVMVRACPLKGGVLEQLAPGIAGNMAGHHMMMAHDITPHERAPVHDHEHAKCNCIGDYCASILAVLSTLGTYVPVPQALIAYALEYPRVDRVVEEPEYFRPPSTAPPAI